MGESEEQTTESGGSDSQRSSQSTSQAIRSSAVASLKGRKGRHETASSKASFGDRQRSRGTGTSKTKPEQAQQRLSLWRRQANPQSQSIDSDGLRELLDIVTTRMRATEGLMGQPLQEEQLVSIVGDVLQSRQEGDCVGTLSGTSTSSNSLQQLVVVIMTLLLKQKNIADAASSIGSGVSTVVMASLEKISQIKSHEQEAKDALSEVSGSTLNQPAVAPKAVVGKESIESKENIETSNNVEYTIEDLQAVLSTITAAREVEDDESSVSSAASTLNVSFIEELSTMDIIFEKFVDLLSSGFRLDQDPDDSMLQDPDDSMLEPLEEESDYESIDNETVTVFDDETTACGGDAKQSAPETSFFGALFGYNFPVASMFSMKVENKNEGKSDNTVASKEIRKIHSNRVIDPDDSPQTKNADKWLGSEVTVNSSENLEHAVKVTAGDDEVQDGPTTSDSQFIFDNLYQTSDLFRSSSFHKELDERSLLRLSRSLDDNERQLVLTNIPHLHSSNANDSAEVAWDRLEQTLEDHTQQRSQSEQPVQDGVSHRRSCSLPKLAKCVLKPLGNTREAKAESQTTSIMSLELGSSRESIDAPGAHADLTLAPSAVSWDEVPSVDNLSERKSHNAASTVDSKKKLPSVSSTRRNHCAIERLPSTSSTSRKGTVGSLDSTQSLGTPHLTKPSVLLRKTEVVRKPLSMPAPIAETRRKNPFAVRIVYQQVVSSEECSVERPVAEHESTDQVFGDSTGGRSCTRGSEESRTDRREAVSVGKVLIHAATEYKHAAADENQAKKHETRMDNQDGNENGMVSEGLDDSTEAAWDRLEIPLNEVLKTSTNEKPKITHTAGFHSWMSRRTHQRTGTASSRQTEEVTKIVAVPATDAKAPYKLRDCRKGIGPPFSEEQHNPTQPQPPKVQVSLMMQQHLKGVGPSPAENNVEDNREHAEMSFTLDEYEAREVQSTINMAVDKSSVNKPSSRWNEKWYTKYMEKRRYADSSVNANQRSPPEAAGSVLGQQPNSSPLSIDSASSITGSIATIQSSKVNFLVDAVEHETGALNEWESFSNSPFNEAASDSASQVQGVADDLLEARFSHRAKTVANSDRVKANAKSKKVATSSGGKKSLHSTTTATRKAEINTDTKSKKSAIANVNRGLETWRSREVLQAERSTERSSKGILRKISYGCTRKTTESTDGEGNSAMATRTTQDNRHSLKNKPSVANVKQRAREAAQKASFRSSGGKENAVEMNLRRDPTPRRSNVTATEQWKFFNPDEASVGTPFERTPASLADHPINKHRANNKNGKKSSPSSVAVHESNSPFEDAQFTRQFGDDNGFDAETSFPPF